MGKKSPNLVTLLKNEDLISREHARNTLEPMRNGHRSHQDPKLVTKPSLKRPAGWLGTNVMIFQIFSPKNLVKKLAFLIQNKAKLCKKLDHNNGFWVKRQFFWPKIAENCRKLPKIAENCQLLIS
jgi:hypothetical protein